MQHALDLLRSHVRRHLNELLLVHRDSLELLRIHHHVHSHHLRLHLLLIERHVGHLHGSGLASDVVGWVLVLILRHILHIVSHSNVL